MNETQTRGTRKIRCGVVVSDAMDKTVAVGVERTYRHPRYGKVIRKTEVFKVHDEGDQARVGDQVEIMETRPLSKTKRWRLVSILKAAPRAPSAPVPEPSAPASAAPAAGSAEEPASR
jgi:small subunit ribosomal protein S17